ncbi:MAG: VWA domain-containing protein [Terracidiphilus sp.]
MRNRCLACIVVLLALQFPAIAQDQGTVQPSSSLSKQERIVGSAGQQNFVIRQTVRRVLVDIVVTDKAGQPVRGLKMSDFSVDEDGKPQRLLSFDVEDSDKPAFVSPKLPPLPANTFIDLPSTPEKGPLYILLYDMVNTEQEDQMTGHKQLLNFIDSKPEGARFAIFANTDGLHLLQGFTSDRALLRAAILSRGPGPHLPDVFLYGRDYGEGSTIATISVFNFLADYMDGIPGRKNLIWLSGSFPVALNADPSHERDAESEDVKRAFAAMARSQIAVYPVDVGGVRSMARYEGMAQSTPAGARSAESITKGGMATLPGTAGAFLQSTDIASFTGGRFYTGSNDVSGEIYQAVEHGANYYTVSYRPSNEKYDGRARHIQVRVAEKGYKVEYRQLYYAVAPDAEEAVQKQGTKEAHDARAVAGKTDDTLYADIEHGAPLLHDVIFEFHVGAVGAPAMATLQQMEQLEDEPAYFRSHRMNRAPKPLAPMKLQKYSIDYRVLDPQLKTLAAVTGRPAMLEFAAVAYDADGRLLNGVLNDGLATAASTPGEKAEAIFRGKQEIDVPLGAAWIRIAVRDTLTNRVGALEIPLPLQPEAITQAARPGN